MEKSNKHIIIYTFQSLEDPLVKGLILQYLYLVNRSNKYVFHLITHEQISFRLSPADEKIKQRELKEHSIEWYPVPYHNGKMLIFKKAMDFIRSAFICAKIKWKYDPKLILGFLPLAAGYCSILAPLLRLKLITYCFEPHSEYMLDFGLWKKNGWKYALLKKYENNQIELSSYIIVPTHHTLDLVNKLNPVSRKFILPISIDTQKNIFDAAARSDFRKKYQLEDKYTFLYMGKFGGIYYPIEKLVDFFYAFKKLGNYHLMIISDAKNEINGYITDSKLDESFFTVLDYVPYEKLNRYISAADMGIIAVPPLPSQKYRTPVKTSLYLSCGIPYLVNKGIAEDDTIALQDQIGVVTSNFESESALEVHNRIQETFVGVPDLPERCRNYAVRNRSHELAVGILENIFEKELN